MVVKLKVDELTGVQPFILNRLKIERKITESLNVFEHFNDYIYFCYFFKTK